MGFLDKLKEGLKKTRDGIAKKVDRILVSFGRIDEDLFDELEQALIESDVGVNTSVSLIADLKMQVKEHKITEPSQVKDALKLKLKEILINSSGSLLLDSKTAKPVSLPSVITVIGVNGVGKTTSIAKLAYKFKQEGKTVLLAAADTFRAAAIDQLSIWSDRAGIDIIKHSEGSDPAAVVFDAIQAAKARHVDVLICDTAGRLHTRKNLMEELKKVERIIKRELPDSLKETLLVLDSTTGQNAISQARTFNEYVDVSGIVLTKLDGTAKGGIVIAVASELEIPVKMIGIGEKMEDLQAFEPNEFIDALFE